MASRCPEDDSQLQPVTTPEVVTGPPLLPTGESNRPECVHQKVSKGYAVLAGRLHPLTLVIALARAVRAFAIPALFVLVTGSGGTLGFALLVMLGLNLLAAFVRYATFSYRLDGDELLTRQGVLSRKERHIPLRRVQDLRLEAGPIHRVLGVVDVHVETAGGEGVEAALSVLSRSDAEALRQALFAAAGREPVSVDAGTDTGEVLVKLTALDLVVEGLTSNRAASVLVLVGAAFGFADNFLPREQWQSWLERLGKDAEQWFAQDGSVEWSAVFAVVGIVVVVSALFSVAGSLVLFHGFALVRRGEDLFRTYGLLTRRASSLPRRRIQLLQLNEPWLRRLFGLVAVRADTAAGRSAGDEAQRRGRDVLVPLMDRAKLARLLPELIPDVGDEPDHWSRVAACAVRRATKKGVLACLVLVLALAAGPLRTFGTAAQLHGLWALALVPLIHWINRRSYARLGFADTGTVFRTRRGWLGRMTHVVPIRNLQVVVLRQTPFDRRYGVSTLKLDTAGQAYTGGGPALRNLPGDVALAAARSLAVRAAQTRYRT